MKTAKTNQKEVYAKAFEYILNAIDDSGYDKELKTDKDKLNFVIECFNSEYGHEIMRLGYQKAFTGWMQGLPSCFNIDFENYRIIEIAKEWGSIPADADDKLEDKILEGWWNFIYMRFIGLCKKHKLTL